MTVAPPLDPRDDPRTPWLLKVDPGEVRALATNFQTAARESADCAVGLQAAQHDGHWTGDAAQAFRQAIGRLPQQLQNIHEGYAGVRRALETYENALADIQPRFQRAYLEYVALQGQLDAALRQDHLDLQTLASQKGIPGVTREQRRQLERTIIADGQAVHTAQSRSDEVKVQCQRLLSAFSEARRACRSAIAAAAGAAPVRRRSRAGQGVTVVGVVEGGGHGVNRHPRAVVNHASHRPLAGGPGQPRGRAREQIQTMTHTAHSLIGTRYSWGGGHGAWNTGGGLDCSGFVSAVLHSAGFLAAPQTTEGLAAQPGIAAGAGQWVTIYDRTGCGANEHVIIDLHGTFYESGGGSASGGAPYVHRFTPSHEYLASFHTILHPVGL